jgi:hypothetical protein
MPTFWDIMMLLVLERQDFLQFFVVEKQGYILSGSGTGALTGTGT